MDNDLNYEKYKDIIFENLIKKLDNKIKIKKRFEYLTSDDFDFKNNVYSITELKLIIEHCIISLKNITRLQKLTSDFCKDYILNERYYFLDYDKDIDINFILKYQSHLCFDDFYFNED